MLISLARTIPARCTCRCTAPISGLSPIVASTDPIFEDRAAMMKSHASAISSPPPTQTPCTEATMGIGQASRSRRNSSGEAESSPPSSASPNSEVSAPAEKCLRPLFSKIARAPLSCASCKTGAHASHQVQSQQVVRSELHRKHRYRSFHRHFHAACIGHEPFSFGDGDARGALANRGEIVPHYR
jgi:hypothetical protein